QGDSPLHAASRIGDQQTLDLLLRAGAHVNATNRVGLTPLHDARNSAICRRLLSAGADPTIKSRFGEDAVAFALRLHRVDVAAGITNSAEPAYGEVGTYRNTNR